MEAMAVIRFTYSCSQDELDALAYDFAEKVKPTVSGLRWKIFLNDPDKQRSAGLYLFEDRASATAYAEGPHVQGLRASPAVSDCSVEVFETMRGPSLKAGAPLPAASARAPAHAAR